MRSGAPWQPAKGSTLSVAKLGTLPSKWGTGEPGKADSGAILLKEDWGGGIREKGLGPREREHLSGDRRRGSSTFSFL